MNSIIQFSGKDHVLQLFGVRLLGITPENGKKLLMSVVFLFVLFTLNRILRAVSAAALGTKTGPARFWAKQVIRIATAVLLITGMLSIWFNDPGRLANAAAFVTAGLAIASQRVITAISAYLIILRGKTFHVGDRIVMGGVRGDVIALGFIQTTIMEMGQAPPEQSDAPSVWVAGRQYTGRIVTVSNDKIFDEPVYNYTRDFPYIWEEMRLPIPYSGDRNRAEEIILHAAQRHTTKVAELSEDALTELERRFMVKRESLNPRVYFRLTDNWVEMSVRFITEDHGIRHVKDAMSREILDEFDQAHISIASGTYEIVGLPEVKVHLDR
uniref:MscS Mechanosensitive ion channel n=1 Tax=Solibacter usitatus (strain Ellin6076) TaxID=234267 RepID=Q028D3_SOLUE